MRRITLIPNTSKIVQVNNYLFKKAKCPKQKTWDSESGCSNWEQ